MPSLCFVPTSRFTSADKVRRCWPPRTGSQNTRSSRLHIGGVARSRQRVCAVRPRQVGHTDEETNPIFRRRPIRIPNKVLDDVEGALHYKFKDRALLRTALIHASAAQERPVIIDDAGRERPLRIDNERLEYLGDAVLYITLAEMLFKHRPQLAEGDMTHIRGRLLTKDACAAYIKNLNLERFLILGNRVRRHELRVSNAVMGDFFEALLGAIYLDGGNRAVRKFLEDVILPTMPSFAELAEDAQGVTKTNYRNRLQAFLQKRFRGLPTMVEEKVEGPDHEKRFTYSVLFNDKVLGTAEGVSKKQAVNLACRIALCTLGLDPEKEKFDEDDSNGESVEESDVSEMELLSDDALSQVWPKYDYKGTLLEKNLASDLIRYVELERMECFNAEDAEDRFVYGVSMEESLVSVGSGRTKKDAEQRAARRFWSPTYALDIFGKVFELKDAAAEGLLADLAAVMIPTRGQKEVESTTTTAEQPSSTESPADDEQDKAIEVAERVIGMYATKEEAKQPEEDLDENLQQRLEHYRLVDRYLDILFDHGILQSLLADAARKRMPPADALFRSVERVARVSSDAALLLASHYSALTAFLLCDAVYPKLREEVLLDVMQRKFLFAYVDVSGAFQDGDPEGEFDTWSISGVSKNHVANPLHVSCFLVALHDEETSARGMFLVPSGTGITFEHDENNDRVAKVRFEQVAVPRKFKLERNTAPETGPASSDGKSQRTESAEHIIDSCWFVLYPALLGAAGLGQLRTGSRLLAIGEDIPSKELFSDALGVVQPVLEQFVRVWTDLPSASALDANVDSIRQLSREILDLTSRKLQFMVSELQGGLSAEQMPPNLAELCKQVVHSTDSFEKVQM
mmetsp:Transcript_7566/g.22962  ORF Transcript_7566/g.22962 Transcript_7566/m.22962 type:complete len:857 (-) Transcript_7566:36-2606(-)